MQDGLVTPRCDCCSTATIVTDVTPSVDDGHVHTGNLCELILIFYWGSGHLTPCGGPLCHTTTASGVGESARAGREGSLGRLHLALDKGRVAREKAGGEVAGPG